MQHTVHHAILADRSRCGQQSIAAFCAFAMCNIRVKRIAGPCWQPGLRWSPGEGGMTVMPKNRAPRICLGIFFAIFVAPALAHDPSHPELNTWFNRLASGRGLCCSLTDGVTVADPDWESREGHYRVRLYGEWIDVPDDALITEPNRAGQTMVWPMLFNGVISVRCFMPASGHFACAFFRRRSRA